MVNFFLFKNLIFYLNSCEMSNCSMQDPYRILNVDRYADKTDIDYQYERLRRTVSSSDQVRMLEEAYVILTDEEKRKEYDQGHLVDERAGTHWAEIEPYQARLCLNVRDVLYGCYKDVTITYRKPCGVCDETGIDEPKKNIVRCRECGGSGVNAILRMACMGCKGDGMFVLRRIACGICNGSCYQNTNCVRSVYLRPGYAQNEVVHIESGVTGTIYIDTSSDPQIYFRNNHAYVNVEITLFDLLIGLDRQIAVGDHEHALRMDPLFDFEKDVPLSSFGRKGILYAHFVIRALNDAKKLKLLRRVGSAIRDMMPTSGIKNEIEANDR